MADEKRDKEGIGLLIAVGVAFALAILVPAVLAVPLFLVLRSSLTRREGLAIAGIGLGGLALGQAVSCGQLLGGYCHWPGVLVVGRGDRLALPVLSILLLALFAFGLRGADERQLFLSRGPQPPGPSADG